MKPLSRVSQGGNFRNDDRNRGSWHSWEEFSRTAGIYFQHCAGCHGVLRKCGTGDLRTADATALDAENCTMCCCEGRLGGQGLALTADTLRPARSAGADVIAHCRPATQMRGFAQMLSAEDIDRLTRFIIRPLAAAPS